jgi:hypothetical protein
MNLLRSPRVLSVFCAVACLVQGLLHPEQALGCLVVGVFMVVFAVALS